MKKLNPKDYPYLAALIQALQYGHAGFVMLSYAGAFFAGTLGLLMSFAVALASSKINDIAKKRKPSAWFALLALMIVSPAFVGVGMWLALDIIPSPFWRVVVSALWGLIPDGSVALVGFIAGKGLVASEDKPAKAEPKPAKAKKSAFVCATCGFEAKSQAALNGHQRKHSKVTGYKVSFEPVTDREKKENPR